MHFFNASRHPVLVTWQEFFVRVHFFDAREHFFPATKLPNDPQFISAMLGSISLMPGNISNPSPFNSAVSRNMFFVLDSDTCLQHSLLSLLHGFATLSILHFESRNAQRFRCGVANSYIPQRLTQMKDRKKIFWILFFFSVASLFLCVLFSFPVSSSFSLCFLLFSFWFRFPILAFLSKGASIMNQRWIAFFRIVWVFSFFAGIKQLDWLTSSEFLKTNLERFAVNANPVTLWYHHILRGPV